MGCVYLFVVCEATEHISVSGSWFFYGLSLPEAAL